MKIPKKIYSLAIVFTAFAPLMVSAATLQDGLVTIRKAIDFIIPMIMALAILIFLWGIVKYILASGDPAKEKAARSSIIYGLLGVLVLVAFWGIIQIVTSTFDIETGGTLPKVNVPF